MQTTSIHTPVRRGGALVRTVRAVSRWFSQSVNALAQPSANADRDRWFDWPRFPPFLARRSMGRRTKSAVITAPSCSHLFGQPLRRSGTRAGLRQRAIQPAQRDRQDPPKSCARASSLAASRKCLERKILQKYPCLCSGRCLPRNSHEVMKEAEPADEVK